MKVCIIGGTGTLSTPITNILINNENIDCTLINRGKSLEKIDASKVTLWKTNINDKKKMMDYLENASFDVVINFINYHPDEVKRDIRYFKDKTKQYIFISTNVVLNHHEHCEISENTEIGNRISAYGQNKAACEKVLRDTKDFPYTIVRPSHTYSDDRFPVSIKGKDTWTVFERIAGGKEIIVQDHGQSIWPITHADDFARLFVSLVGNEKALYETYHIMNPKPLTWDMIYQEIARQTKGTYRPVYIPTSILEKSEKYNFKEAIAGDKAFSNIFNIDKILSLNPNFEFEVDLKEGVKRFLSYMDSNPSLKNEDSDFNVWSDETIKNYKNLISNFIL